MPASVSDPVELGDHAERLGELVAAAQRVQERGVHRVHAVVLHLQPVARQRELRRRHELVARHLVAVVHRKRRAPIRRPQVREDQPRELVRGIGALTDALGQPAARRLARRLQAPAVDVVDPAVIAAADAALDRDAELQRRSPMRAVQVQHADAPAAIAKDHEVLAEDAHAQRRAGELAGEGHRLPEPAQVLAARRAGTDLGQLRIGRGDGAAVVAVEGREGHAADYPTGRSTQTLAPQSREKRNGVVHLCAIPRASRHHAPRVRRPRAHEARRTSASVPITTRPPPPLTAHAIRTPQCSATVPIRSAPNGDIPAKASA